MSTPSTGYRGTQVIGNGGLMENIMTSDAVYADYLRLMGGDVAATLAWLRDIGKTPTGTPVPTVSSPLSTTNSVVQDPGLQPGLSNVYQNFSVTFTPVLNGHVYIAANNEIVTSPQPTIQVFNITSPKAIPVVYVAGQYGTAQVSNFPYTKYARYRIFAGSMIVGKSKLTYYQSDSPVLNVPVISQSNSVISITKPTSQAGFPLETVKVEWRKKDSNWLWQPYVGPFTKPTGSGYTIQARALRFGFNDNSATAELVIT